MSEPPIFSVLQLQPSIIAGKAPALYVKAPALYEKAPALYVKAPRPLRFLAFGFHLSHLSRLRVGIRGIRALGH